MENMVKLVRQRKKGQTVRQNGRLLIINSSPFPLPTRTVYLEDSIYNPSPLLTLFARISFDFSASYEFIVTSSCNQWCRGSNKIVQMGQMTHNMRTTGLSLSRAIWRRHHAREGNILDSSILSFKLSCRLCLC